MVLLPIETKPTMSSKIAPDLKLEVTTLASNIEVAMASLYSLHTYLTHTRGSHSQPLRDIFTPLRRDLKQSWGSILVFLQKLYAFGTDITTLKDSLWTESVEDCIDFLMDLSSTSGDLLRLSEVMVADSGHIVEEFARCAPRMGFVPQEFAQRTTPTHEGQVSSCSPSMGRSDGTAYDNHSSHQKQPSILASEERELASFVEANLAANRPDGVKYLSATQDSLTAIKIALEHIHEFWRITSEACEAFVATSSGGGLNVTFGKAEQVATVWKEYQEALKRAITSIARSCDAILVDAVVYSPPPLLPTPPYPFPQPPRSRILQNTLCVVTVIGAMWFLVGAIIKKEEGKISRLGSLMNWFSTPR